MPPTPSRHITVGLIPKCFMTNTSTVKFSVYGGTVIQVFSDVLVAFATKIRVTPNTKIQNFLLLSKIGYFYKKY